MTATIDFYWDIGSTNSYFALKLMQPIAAKYDAVIRWHPFNLGFVFQSNSYVLMEEPKTKLKNRRDDLMRWARRNDLPFKMPSRFPIKTSRALRGAIAMRQWNKELAYMEAIFSAYWEQDVGTIGEYDTLCPIAESLGVDGAAFEAASESEDVREALVSSTNTALERGVFGVPSVMIGDALYWGKDRFDFIEAHLKNGQSV